MAEILDIFGIDARLLFIQIVNFGIVVLILWWFLYRPVIKMIDERNKKVKESVETAEAIEAEKQQIDGERTEILSAANKEGEEIIARARTHGQETEATIISEAQDRSEALLRDAQLRAEEDRKALLQKSERELAQTAILAAEKIMKQRA